MKRKREEEELNDIVHKLNRLEPTLKRKHEETVLEANKRTRTTGEFHYTINEYKKIIVSLYNQNKRLLTRARNSEEAHKQILIEIKKRGLESRNWLRPSSPQYVPTVVM